MKVGDIVYYAEFSKHWWYRFSKNSIKECRIISIMSEEIYHYDVIRAAGMVDDIFFMGNVFDEDEIVEKPSGEYCCFSTNKEKLYNTIKKEIAKSIEEIILSKESELNELKEKLKEFNSNTK